MKSNTILYFSDSEFCRLRKKVTWLHGKKIFERFNIASMIQFQKIQYNLFSIYLANQYILYFLFRKINILRRCKTVQKDLSKINSLPNLKKFLKCMTRHNLRILLKIWSLNNLTNRTESSLSEQQPLALSKLISNWLCKTERPNLTDTTKASKSQWQSIVSISKFTDQEYTYSFHFYGN